MRISYNWLRELVEIPDDPSVLGSKLTNVGLTMDAIDEVGSDTILELDVTANRGDCLSHLGVAREAAAIYRTPVRLPETHVADPESSQSSIAVIVDVPDLCGRYTARTIRGVKVRPSPDWMTRRLLALGIRPINNIADITNYVLLELGQPLHAFDLTRLGSREVRVRNAKPGEILDTLDGVARKLGSTELAITDGSRPIALAGIIGGRGSEISDQTVDVLIESAWFDSLSVRRTSRAHHLSTEASYRFERGTDPEMVARASDRATRLILELAGGALGGPLVDVFPKRTPRRMLGLRRSRIARFLGAPIPGGRVEAILTSLGFTITGTADGWDVTVPSHRHDVAIEEDLLEELARHYGYDRFSATLPRWQGEGRGPARQAEERATREALKGLGYSEICTLAFSDRATEQRFTPEAEPVTLRNPLTEDQPVLRTSLLPSMLRALRWNLNRDLPHLRFYELGKVYPSEGEHWQLVMAMTGMLWPRNVHKVELASNFYAIKGDVEALVSQFASGGGEPADPIPDYYAPGRSVRVGRYAVVGELDPRVARDFRIRQDVYLAEIQIEELHLAGLRTVAVTPIPKYPRVRRDFSLLVERKVRFSNVEAAVNAAGIDELVAIVPFDRLESGPFPESCYSLAIGVEYQSPERTLTDEEIEEYDRRVLSRLEAIGARLRS